MSNSEFGLKDRNRKIYSFKIFSKFFCLCESILYLFAVEIPFAPKYKSPPIAIFIGSISSTIPATHVKIPAYSAIGATIELYAAIPLLTSYLSDILIF